jgi:hypothetical protein
VGKRAGEGASKVFELQRSHSMKVLVGAALGATLLATSAFAQTTPSAPAAPAAPVTSSCGELQGPPTLPDGATSTREQMQEANTAFQAWYQAYSANIACRRAEVTNLRAQYDGLTAAHNAAVETMNTTNTQWAAEAEEFNSRGGRRSN